MTVVAVTKAGWTAVNTVAQRVQVFGGRVQIATSATPTADDWMVFPKGAVVDVTVPHWARAVDSETTWIVTQAV